MTVRGFPRRFCSPVLVALGLFSLTACGDGTGFDKRYPVKGKITYNGTPVEKGEISFKPTDPKGHAATGVIENGSYYLTTAVDGDGALPGTYQVTISAREVDLTQAKANAAQGGSLRQDDVAKANRLAKKLIPAKYEIPDTSGLSKDVKAQSNTIDFELTD